METGIVILPNQPTTAQAIELSREISKHEPTEFILNNFNFIPHITLFHGVYEQEKIQGIANVIESILHEADNFSITLSGYSNLLGYIFWDTDKSKALENLHKNLVEKLSPLTSGLRAEFIEMLKTKSVSPRRLEYIRKYGYPLCFEEYIPHITLSRLKNRENSASERLIEALTKYEMSFDFSQIGIVEIGDHGSCKKILRVVQKK